VGKGAITNSLTTTLRGRGCFSVGKKSISKEKPQKIPKSARPILRKGKLGLPTARESKWKRKHVFGGVKFSFPGFKKQDEGNTLLRNRKPSRKSRSKITLGTPGPPVDINRALVEDLAKGTSAAGVLILERILNMQKKGVPAQKKDRCDSRNMKFLFQTEEGSEKNAQL